MSRVTSRRLVATVLPVAAILAALVIVTEAGSQPRPAANQLAPQVGGITCDSTDHRDVPVAVHLSVSVNGVARAVPADVGESSAGCRYWLHTGSTDGVVHADPPPSAHRRFTLGDFFDVWHQPLGTAAVGFAEGTVTSYVNGVRYNGNPRTIPLTNHEIIQLDVGEDIAPRHYTFPEGD